MKTSPDWLQAERAGTSLPECFGCDRKGDAVLTDAGGGGFPAASVGGLGSAVSTCLTGRLGDKRVCLRSNH